MSVLRARAPGKVNLCLFVGEPREDGLHPLVSVVQALSLADELTLEPAAGGADEVVCPGVEGPNLAGRALALYREATGWDAPPQRLTIEKRDPGRGGDGRRLERRRRDPAAGRPRRGPPDPAAQLAPRLGADVASLLRPGRVLMTGAGEHVEPLAPPAPLGVLVLPVDAELSTPAVYREADRLGLTREPRRARRSSTRSSASATCGARERPPGRGALAVPADRRRARRRARRGRRPRARLRLRPDRRRPVRRRDGPPAPTARRRVRLAARGGGRAGRRGLGGRARLMHPFPLAGAIGLAIFLARPLPRSSAGPRSCSASLVAAGLALWGFGIVEPPNLTQLIEDVGTALGKWTYLLVGALAYLETGAFVGLIAPGRERGAGRRRRRRPGRDLDRRR